jgi:hypothetical protein
MRATNGPLLDESFYLLIENLRLTKCPRSQSLAQFVMSIRCEVITLEMLGLYTDLVARAFVLREKNKGKERL